MPALARAAALVVSCALAAGAPGTAEATEGLAWSWEEGQTRRFLLRAEVVLPEAIEMNAELNTDALVGKLTVTVVTSCTAEKVRGKKSTLLGCDFEDAAVIAEPQAQSQGITGPVAEEWATRLVERAHLEIVQGTDGKIRTFTLTGLPDRIRRTRAIAENMRQVLRRVFAPLDIHLPRKGDDKGQGAWRQREAMVFALPSTSNSLGGIDFTHTVQGVSDDGVVSWLMQGRGMVGSTEELGGASRNTLDLDLDGTARFDVDEGTLLDAQYYCEGKATASSIQAEAGREGAYIQVAMAKLLTDGETPDLPTSGEK